MDCSKVKLNVFVKDLKLKTTTLESRVCSHIHYSQYHMFPLNLKKITLKNSVTSTVTLDLGPAASDNCL